MLKMFSEKKPDPSTPDNKLAAINLLYEMRKEYENTPQKDMVFSKSMWIEICNSLLKVINGAKPLDTAALENAFLLDTPNKGNPIVKTLLEMGVEYSSKEIELAREFNNEEAAKLLEDQLVSKSSLSTTKPADFSYNFNRRGNF